MAEIEQHYIDTFNNTLDLLAQQTKSKLEPLVTVQPCHGKATAVKHFLGSVEAREKTERFEKVKDNETPRFRRWLMPRTFYTSEKLDYDDLMRALEGADNSLAAAHDAAMKRKKDGVILSCMFAAARTGELPTSGTTPYNTGNDIAADIDLPSTPSGLTPYKLVKAKSLAIANQIDADTNIPAAVMNSKGYLDLFAPAVTTYTSGDFNKNQPLANASSSIFYAGANLVSLDHADQPRNGTTEWYLPYWFKEGIVLGVWSQRKVSITPVNDEVDSYRIKIIEKYAATRVDEKMVYRIKIKHESA